MSALLLYYTLVEQCTVIWFLWSQRIKLSQECYHHYGENCCAKKYPAVGEECLELYVNHYQWCLAVIPSHAAGRILHRWLQELYRPKWHVWKSWKIIPKNTFQMFICAFYTVYHVHTFQIPLVLETVSVWKLRNWFVVVVVLPLVCIVIVWICGVDFWHLISLCLGL